MVVLFIIFGFIQISLISNVIFKCTTKQAARRPPGQSARSSKSLQLLKSRSGSNLAQKSSSSNNNNKKRNIRSLPSRASQPKSVDAGGGGSSAAGGGTTGNGGGEKEANEKSRELPQPPKKFKKPEHRREPKTPDEDYGEVPEPTESAKKRREKQLEEEKLEKIGKGFYQPKSDEDDTLEPIQSLKEERTENSTKKSSKKKAQAE